MCNVNSIHDRQTTSEGCHVLAWGRAERERERERKRQTYRKRESQTEKERGIGKFLWIFNAPLTVERSFLVHCMLIDHYKRYLPASYLNGTYKSMPLSVHVA